MISSFQEIDRARSQHATKVSSMHCGKRRAPASCLYVPFLRRRGHLQRFPCTRYNQPFHYLLDGLRRELFVVLRQKAEQIGEHVAKRRSIQLRRSEKAYGLLFFQPFTETSLERPTFAHFPRFGTGNTVLDMRTLTQRSSSRKYSNISLFLDIAR